MDAARDRATSCVKTDANRKDDSRGGVASDVARALAGGRAGLTIA